MDYRLSSMDYGVKCVSFGHNYCRMKFCFTILLLVLTQGLVFGQVNWANEPFILKDIKGQTIKSVSVKTLYGNITVIGTSSQPSIEVYVDAINESAPSKEELKALVKQDYAIDMVVKNHQLMVTASCKLGESNWKKALSISFKIFVPKDVTTDLQSKVGSIGLVNLDGNQTFDGNGAVNIEAVDGVIKGKTGGGSINLSNSGPEIDINTGSGDIVAVNCHGKLKLDTKLGGINLSRLKGNIETSTTIGNVEGDEIDGDFTAKTDSGNITLKRLSCHLKATIGGGGSLNAELSKVCKSVMVNVATGGANISLTAKQGFNLNLDGKSVSAPDMPKKFSGSNEATRISGAVYGGGVPVEVHAPSGEIKVKFI